MNTLVLKSTASLVNPPADTPVFSALPYLPQASFNARKLAATNEVDKPVILPFSFDGTAAANTRIFTTAGSTGAPIFTSDQGINCLSFDGTTSLGQTTQLTLNRNFTLAVAMKVDEYTDQANSRIVSIGTQLANRAYLTIRENGMSIGAGGSGLYLDSSKPTGFVCVVVKFNGANSRYVNNKGELITITLTETAEISNFVRMGTSTPSTITDGFKGKIAGWKFYQEDLTDAELIALHEEMRVLYSI